MYVVATLATVPVISTAVAMYYDVISTGCYILYYI